MCIIFFFTEKVCCTVVKPKTAGSFIASFVTKHLSYGPILYKTISNNSL